MGNGDTNALADKVQRRPHVLLVLLVSMAIALSVVAPAFAYEPSEGTYGVPWVNSNVEGMLASLEKLDPGEDFYANANYDYLRNTTVPVGSFSGSVYQSDTDAEGRTLDQRIEGVIDQAVDATNPDENQQIVKDFYDLYNNGTTDADRALFCAYLGEIISIQTVDDLKAYIASDACRDHGATLLTAVLDGHDLSLSGLESTWALDDETAVSKLRELLGDGFDADTVIARANAFEALVGSELEFDETFNKRYTAGELAGIEHLPVSALMEQYGTLTVSSIYANLLETLDAYFVDGSFGEGELAGVTHLDAIKSLMIKQYLAKYIDALSKGSGADGVIASIRGNLPVQVDHLYIAQYCSAQARQRILDMMMEVRDAYRSMLDGETWLSETTRAAAQEKLDKLSFMALYPDEMPACLHEFKDSHSTGSGTIDGQGYLTALLDLREFQARLEREAMQTPEGQRSMSQSPRQTEHMMPPRIELRSSRGCLLASTLTRSPTSSSTV